MESIYTRGIYANTKGKKMKREMKRRQKRQSRSAKGYKARNRARIREEHYSLLREKNRIVGDYNLCATNTCTNRVGVVKKWADSLASQT